MAALREVNGKCGLTILFLMCVLKCVFCEVSYVDIMMNSVTDDQQELPKQKDIHQFLMSDGFVKWRNQLKRDEILKKASQIASNQTSLARNTQNILQTGNLQTFLNILKPMIDNLSKSKQGSNLLQNVIQGMLQNKNGRQLQGLIPFISSLGNPKQFWNIVQTAEKNGDLSPLFSVLPGFMNGTIRAIFNSSNPQNWMAELTNGTIPEFASQFIRDNLNAETAKSLALGYLETRIQSLNASSSCARDVINVINGLSARQLWALKMLDASAKIPSGLLDLNLHWWGSFDECVSGSLGEKYFGYFLPRDYSISSVESKYCTATINLPIPGSLQWINQLGSTSLNLGICVPKSCSNTELKSMTNALLSSIPIMNQTLKSSGVKCAVTEVPYKTEDIVMIVLCGFFATIMVLGTIYDLVAIELPKFKLKRQKEYEKTVENGIDNKYRLRDSEKMSPIYDNAEKTVENGIDTKHRLTNGEKAPPVYDNVPKVDTTAQQSSERTVMEKILLSFSIYTNGRKLLNTTQPAGSLTAVNGIRFLSMSWVILGHTLAFIRAFTGNYAPWAAGFLKRHSSQAIINASFSVDSFFTLSGLLTSYLVMKQMKKAKGKINWVMFYVHRYWRLTPVYMIMIGLWVGLFPHLVTGPSYHGDRDVACQKTWWWNLLYISNFVPNIGDLCFGHSWYLNNDMQFYIICPLMLLPLFYKEAVGVCVCVIFLLASAITPGVYVYTQKLRPNVGSWFVDVYIKPYCRFGPYMAGFITGYILYRLKNKCRIHILVNLALWVVAAASASATLYGLYDVMQGHPLTMEVSALYDAVSRLVWGICVSWVIFACATGNGGPINTILSWGGFVPLARLTYCAYLIHPSVQYLFYLRQRTPLYLNDLNFVYLFLGHLAVSYGCAFITSLAFEAPFMGLEKVIFKSHGGSKRST